jgi:glycosyltransferase involved in cell wall biosynthesis
MIEAMANGTPVIAFNHGAVPEVVENGVSGFVVKDVEDAVRALENIDCLNRNVVRKAFEEKFNASIMATRYIQVFEKLIRKSNVYPVEKKLLELKNQVDILK